MEGQTQPLEVLCEKAVLKNFANFRGKHMCWSSIFNKFTDLKKETQSRCFLIKFAKLFATPILKNFCEQVLLEGRRIQNALNYLT